MRATFIMLALAAVPMPALADWQPTKWGMTSDEVVKATGNRAKANPDPKAEDDEKLMMTYAEGGINFTVFFEFDKAMKLNAVNLVPANPDCKKAFDLLKAKYGAPASVAQGAVGDMEKWPNVAGSNRIMALALPSQAAANYCSITYRAAA